MFANVQRVKNNTGVHVALIGHTGKDESRGARGSNALLGDVDVMVTIGGDEIKTATVTKANDAPEGAAVLLQVGGSRLRHRRGRRPDHRQHREQRTLSDRQHSEKPRGKTDREPGDDVAPVARRRTSGTVAATTGTTKPRNAGIGVNRRSTPVT